MKKKKPNTLSLPQRCLRRLRADPWATAIFTGARARAADRQEHFLAVLELVQQPLRQFGLLRVRRRREERLRHHLA
jgi:hypothetical protein